MRKNIIRILTVFILLGIAIQPVSACHWVVGKVNDADNGMSANDRQVIIYPYGFKDKFCMSDTIGKNGNSKTDNYYMVDIEQICPCNIEKAIGVVLIAEVVDNGDGYKTPLTYTIITGNGYDEAYTIQLEKVN